MKIGFTYYQREQMDAQKWDEFVLQNSMQPYSFSWHLDAVSPNWAAIIADDYSWVLPLCETTKFGLKGILQPILSQQLGFVGSVPDSLNEITDFLKMKYWFVRMNGVFLDSIYTQKQRVNLELDLNRNYEDLRANYSDNCKRNLKKAEKVSLTIKPISEKDSIAFFMQNKGGDINLPSDFEVKTNTLFAEYKTRNKIKSYAVYNENELLCIASFLCTENRMINILPSSNGQGMEKRAMYFLLDFIIKENAKTPMILDFEGSMIDGVARFYKGFGAETKFYSCLNLNKFDFLNYLMPW